MKKNLSEIRLLVDDSFKELSILKRDLKTNCIKKSTKEITTGSIEVLSDDDFDFDSNFEKYLKISDNIAKLKSILSHYNDITCIENNLSIQEGLNKILQMRENLSFLEDIMYYKPNKERVTEMNSSYFKISELKFNRNVLIQKRNILKEEINRIEILIEQVNSSTFVDVNL